MQFRSLPQSVVDAIYLRADQLEVVWSNANLSLNFRDRMIDKTIALLHLPGVEKTPAIAVRILNFVWNRNACRDYKRNVKKPRRVSLDDVQEVSVPAQEPSAVRAQIASIKRVLGDVGCRPVVAEAFIQCALNDKDAEALDSIQSSLGVVVKAATLRKWREREFDKISSVLRLNAERLGLSEGSCHTDTEVMASEGHR